MKTIYYIVDNKYREKEKIDWTEIVSVLVGGSIMAFVFWGFLIII